MKTLTVSLDEGTLTLTKKPGEPLEMTVEPKPGEWNDYSVGERATQRLHPHEVTDLIKTLEFFQLRG